MAYKRDTGIINPFTTWDANQLATSNSKSETVLARFSKLFTRTSCWVHCTYSLASWSFISLQQMLITHTHIQCTQLRFALQQDDTAAASSALTVDVSMNQAYWGYRWPSSFAGSEQAPGSLWFSPWSHWPTSVQQGSLAYWVSFIKLIDTWWVRCNM